MLGVVLWLLMGIAIGSVVHSQVAALVGTLVWLFLVETLLVGLFSLLDIEAVRRVPPLPRARRRRRTGGDNLLDYGPALAVTLGWIARARRRRRRANQPPRHHLTYPARMAAPVRKDEEVELQVDSLAYGGNGVARLNGFVVFVRRGLPGDRVRARVTKVKRGFAEALAVDVLEPSPHRVDAPCDHYPSCGGCRFQDLAYEVQAASKEEQGATRSSASAASRMPPVEPILPAESQSLLPQQAGVLVRADAVGAGARLPQGRDAGTRCSRSRSAG